MQPDEPVHYEDFDSLTGGDNSLAAESFAPSVADDAARRKRQKTFYMVVAVVGCMAAGGVWALFFRSPSVSDVPQPVATAPVPVVPSTDQPTADTAQEGLVPLPEGVTTPQEANAENTAAAPLPMPAESAAASGAAAPSIMDVQKMVAAASVQPVTAPPNTVAEATQPPMPAEGMDAAAPIEALPPVMDQAATIVPAPQPVQNTTAETSAPAPVTAPTTDQAVTSEAMMPPPVEALAPQPVPMAAAPATPEMAPVADPAMNDRLSALENQLQMLASEMQAAKNTPAQGMDPALGQMLQNLTGKLEQITTQVDAIEQRVSTNETTAPVSTETNTAPIDKVIEVKEEVPVKKAAPPVKRKPVVKRAPAPRAAPKAVTAWELRSAQPGVAWIGRVGSGEMARYGVGDNVPGLGTVQSVDQDASGMWVVRTTGGMVRQ